MKKIIPTLILLLIIVLTIIPVKAANYELKELIPIDTKTTIVTRHFSYKSFYYNSKDNSITFQGIKNISDEEIPITISIALFDKNRKNIGTINYCTQKEGKTLQIDEEITYKIEVKKDYLASDKKTKDIKYISVLSENNNCHTGGSLDYVDQTIDEIGIGKNNTLDSPTELLLKVIGVVGGILFALFLYCFLFTNAFRNMDGTDVRQEYAYINKELRNKREYEERTNPKPVKEVKSNKTDEVKAQEKHEAEKENKDMSDLHNFYK